MKSTQPSRITIVALSRAARRPWATPDASETTNRPKRTMPTPTNVTGRVSSSAVTPGAYRRNTMMIPSPICTMPPRYISTTEKVTDPGSDARSSCPAMVWPPRRFGPADHSWWSANGPGPAIVQTT